MNFFRHLKTINHHKWLVMKKCFKLGMYKQGLLHDLSKYSPSEFFEGCKYYCGYMSPHNNARSDIGLSYAWLHHKGRNKHHFEYWFDYKKTDEGMVLSGMKMPTKYVVEMFVDRLSASMNYEGDAYTDSSALNYYNKGKNHYIIHDESRALLEELLIMLSEKGEEYTFKYIKEKVL